MNAMPKIDELAVLTELGDLLYQTDDVVEKNDIGFNKADKALWGMVKGHLVAMKATLFKYKKQLAARLGEEAIEGIDWTLPSNAKEITQAVKDEFKRNRNEAKEQERIAKALRLEVKAEVKVTVEAEGFGLRLESTGKLPRERFNAFLAATRKLGGRCIFERNYLWVVPFSANFEAYKAELSSAHITLGDVPTVADELRTAADVKIRLLPDGKIAIKHPFSQLMNQAYRNAEETVGIIGFDWETKERLIGEGETQDLDEVLAAIKKYHPTWTIGYSFDVDVYRKDVAALIEKRRQITPEVVQHLKEGVAPFPYQVEGYEFYKKFGGRALNSDDMGTGKSLQTLLYAANHGLRTLVICPKNVRRQWLQECDKFFKPGTWFGYEIDSAKTDTDADLECFNIVTINYEIVHKYEAAILAGQFDLLVIDESHRIKNPDAKITQLIQRIGPTFSKRICLSGTPLKNKKRELFTQAELIRPGTFKNEQEIISATYFQTREKLKTFFFRRTKQRELKDLPEKFRTVVPVSAKGLPDLEPDMQVGDLSSLKSELAIAKVPLTISFVEEILEGSGSKVIVFSDSAPAAQAIADHFGDIAVLHIGSTPHEKREQAKAIFNDENSAVRVFVATTGSAREGLNLTVADKVVFNDLCWVPSDAFQAEARAHRLGQKNCVNVYWILASENQFDQKIVRILQAKMIVYEKVINGKKPSQDEEELLAKGITSFFAAA